MDYFRAEALIKRLERKHMDGKKLTPKEQEKYKLALDARAERQQDKAAQVALFKKHVKG